MSDLDAARTATAVSAQVIAKLTKLRPSRLIVALAALLVVSAMFASAGIFSNAAALERLASEASTLHRSNATAGAAGIARAAISQAIVYEADSQLGITAQGDATIAAEEARQAVAEFNRAAYAPSQEVDAFASAAAEILTQVEAGNAGTANRIRMERLEPAYADLTEALGEVQSAAEQAIADTRTSAGRTAWVARILATLAVPAIAMTTYWWWTRRRVEEQHRQMQTWVEAEREVARAKDDLIAGISHELRTPLTSIHGFAEVLLDEEFDPAQARDLLGIIHSESGELARMIEDLLTAARIDAGRLQVSTECTGVCDNVMSVVEPFVRRGRRISTAGPDVEVTADPLRLRQILRNLVSNAVRHGGDNIAVLVEVLGAQAVITVADDGPGVPEVVVSRLFDRFVNGGRGAVLSGSVGLGLSVARELAVRMGGDISYRRHDEITMFEVSIPVAIAERAAHPAAS